VISWKSGFTSRRTKVRTRLTIGLIVLKRGAASWRNFPSQDRLAPTLPTMRARNLGELDLSGE